MSRASRDALRHASSLRVVVLGYIVRGPLGGLVWHHLQYVLGLHRLGHDVVFVEVGGDGPDAYDPDADAMTADPGYGLAFAAAAFGRVGLADRWAYHDRATATWHGRGDVRAWARDADLVLNLSGIHDLAPWAEAVPARAFVDTDPVFTQVRHLTEPDVRARAEAHTAFFTFGERWGQPGCTIPDDGFAWQPTRQPVVLDAWPVTPAPADAPFTTVMQWDSYQVRAWGGRSFGMKSASFDPYLDLPARTDAAFELAVGSPSAPRERLRAAGWGVRDPRPPTRDAETYQRFLARSQGEWSVAKEGYASTQSGWFSERTAAYLASGRPAVVQDTGFSALLPTGLGLHAFATPGEALAAIESVRSDLDRHARAAREIAAEHFDAARVLASLVERALASPTVARSPAARSPAASPTVAP